MFWGLMILSLIFGIVIPIWIFAKKYSNSKNSEKETKTWISFAKAIGYSLIFFCIIAIVAGYYETGTPDSTSDLCTNSGGWVYSCVGDEKVALISFSIIFIFTIIHYKLCEREIYKLKGIPQYVLLISYLAFTAFTSFCLLIILGGLFISAHYDSGLLELFRLIAIFLPMNLFGLSIYWKELR